MKPIFLFLLLPCWSFSQFHINGVASQEAGPCYTLTPNQLFSAGSIWSPAKIDLRESFQAIFKLHMGCTDSGGADGIVFGFQPISTSFGQAGGGLGFQSLAPSLGIEFDTWQNDNYGDPEYDHIAISRDGDLNHNSAFSNLAGPVSADPGDPNIEDCAFHRVRVDWDPGQQLLQVWWDCKLRLSYSGDIVEDIFLGDPWVYWGFTAGTGAASNLQQVCLDYTTFFQQQPDVHICAGGRVQLEVSGSNYYKWSPAEGLDNPAIPNPVAAPSATTTYVVEMRDACQFPFFDTVSVFVHEDSLLVELGPDTSFCEGVPFLLDASPLNPVVAPVAYFWSNGFSGPAFPALESGTYRVTVSLDANCITQDWVTLDRIDLPGLELGPDIVACQEELLLLTAITSGAEQFSWNTGSFEPSLEIEAPGAYSLTVSNRCGVALDTVVVHFQKCESEIYVPNLFTPNFDGINDQVGPMGPEGVGTIVYFRIFDRWGELVFEANDTPLAPASGAWDGAFKGNPLPAGVYAYMLEVRFLNGRIVHKNGDITLLR
ncbi:MAG: gliding motility-associated C-terminal domain-containing protein [Saprospirales bacterium]|nr:gliding motility-associated C-terminal domain-containing protein [Saprospirales bacterium]